MKVPRIIEVTMVWKFGGYNELMWKKCKNPDPPTVTEFGSDKTTKLHQITAVLYGNVGNLSFQFGLPEEREHRTAAYRAITSRFEVAIRDQVFPAGKFSDSARHNEFVTHTIEFAPVSGEPFTQTAAGIVKELMSRFFLPVDRKLPIPQATTSTFWQLGDDRVPFGVALALDLQNGSFRKVRQTYEKQGKAAAARLYNRLYRALRNDPYWDKVQSQVDGAEILVGKRHSGLEFCFTLCIDGYDASSPKIGGAVTSHSMVRTAEEFAETMQKYGLNRYELLQGMRTRHTTGERVPCDKLRYEEIWPFTETLRRKGIYAIGDISHW